MDYTVNKNDTLWKIAQKHNTTVNELLKLNNIPVERANNIQIGQKLKINGNVENNQPTNLVPESMSKERSFLKQNAETIQQQLLSEGFDLGKWGVDNKWGNASQAALDKALANGYELVGTKLVKNNSKSVSKPQDYSDYLFEQGSKHKISNAFATVAHLARAGNTTTDTSVPVGVKQQALGLALKFRPKDADAKLSNGKSVTWSLSKDVTGDYLWKSINGDSQVHDNSRTLFQRITEHPAEHILGQYNITEHPDGSYTISDHYDFNKSGTDYAKKIENPTLYDKLRKYFGNLLLDKEGYDINWTISANEAAKWRDKFNA